MQIRTYAFLLTLFLPTLARAADHCTDPDKYTVDRRCYVTDEQMLQTPFSAVVGLHRAGDESGPYCSGTVVRHDDKYYIFTARHCVASNGIVSDIVARMPLGDEYVASLRVVGPTKQYVQDDWAVYELQSPRTDISFVERAVGGANFGARIIGYGKLKIMSDIEISDFKRDYINYLTTTKSIATPDKSQGVSLMGDIYTRNASVREFVAHMGPKYKSEFFRNQQLKVSTCDYYDGILDGCQGWPGVSGGGIFSVAGDIMGIVSVGNATIGGAEHAHVKRGVRLMSGVTGDEIFQKLSSQ